MKTLAREPDERLLIEAAQSEPARFAELYDMNFERVYAFFARRVAMREEAQDLTAEVFHQALASIVLSSHWEKLVRSHSAEKLELYAAGDEIERSVMLAELVEALPPDQRRVVMQRFVNQKSIREIANHLGRSEGAVKQLQLRALENLREKLGRPI